MTVSADLKTKLRSCDTMKQIITTILDECWFDWEQEEALKWADHNVTLREYMNEA